MSRVRMLIHFGVVPYLVFDGDYLPSKAGTENDRLGRREEAKRLGSELLRLGKTPQAHQEMQKAVDVTPEMAGMLIQELKRANIKYVVAPYEADSQLAYLEKHNHIQAVISEDSDLLVFGVKNLLTKLDQFGECIMIRQEDFIQCRDISFVGWSHDQFRRMAILSGCDYLDNIANLGLKTAHRLLRKHKSIERVLQALRLEGKMKVPPTYMDDFIRAELTFLYQWVFCPMSNLMVNLTAPEKGLNIDTMPFIGGFVEAELAAGVADGSLHPHTKKPLILPNSGLTHTHKFTPLKQPQIAQENLMSKKNMSIGEFFKKRQPLAELDPNSFIMTPRQHELARQASSSSWSSPVIPATPMADRPVLSARSASATVQEESRHRSLETPTQSQAKRQRLCHNDEILVEVADIKSVMTGSSKFFSNSNKGKKERRSRGFSIFSDDSMDDTLMSLPDPVLKSASKEDNTSAPHKAEPEIQSSLVSGQDVDNDDSQITLIALSPGETGIETCFDDAEETFNEDYDSISAKQIDGCFNNFLSNSLLSTKTSSKNQSAPGLSTSSTYSRALGKSSSTSTLKSSLMLPNNDGSTNNGPAIKTVQSQVEISVSTLVPNSSPPNPSDSLAQLAKAVNQGSEDQLISDSEGEDDATKVVDMKRFAYVHSV